MPDLPDIDGYIGRRLDPDEQARFELAMVETPELAAEVDFRQRVKAGLELLEKRGKLAALVQRKRATSWPLAIAASLAIAMTSVWLLRDGSRATQVTTVSPSDYVLSASLPADAKISRTFVLTRTRSREVPILEVDSAKGPVRVRVLVAGNARSAQINLERADGGDWPGRKNTLPTSVKVGSDGFSEVFLDSSALTAGVYDLVATLEGRSERYRFVFSPASAGR